LLFDGGNRQIDGPVAAGIARGRRLACVCLGFLVVLSNFAELAEFAVLAVFARFAISSP
jgi:hypothetical protein